jgi:hypothetical protein
LPLFEGHHGRGHIMPPIDPGRFAVRARPLLAALALPTALAWCALLPNDADAARQLFSCPYEQLLPVLGGPGVAVADLNRDGRPDLVTTDIYGNVAALLGSGGGSFPPMIKTPGGVPSAWGIAVGDLNGGGHSATPEDGVYVLRLRRAGWTATQRIVILK